MNPVIGKGGQPARRPGQNGQPACRQDVPGDDADPRHELQTRSGRRVPRNCVRRKIHKRPVEQFRDSVLTNSRPPYGMAVEKTTTSASSSRTSKSVTTKQARRCSINAYCDNSSMQRIRIGCEGELVIKSGRVTGRFAPICPMIRRRIAPTFSLIVLRLPGCAAIGERRAAEEG